MKRNSVTLADHLIIPAAIGLLCILMSGILNAQTFTTKASWMGQWAFSPGVPHKPSNSIYIPGTYQFGDIDQFVRYNVLADSWSSVPGLPAIKSEFGFNLQIGNRIFFGGGVDQPGTFSNVVYEFIPPGTFTPIDNIPNGPASGFSLSIGNFGFVGNGMISGFANLNTMYRLNPLAVPGTQWTNVTAYPGSGKINCGNASLNGFGYVGLGRSNPGSTEYNDFWRYDPGAGAGGTWTAMAAFPGTARECPIISAFCGKLILMGGWNAGTNAYFQDYWEFDPANGPAGTWTLLGTNPAVWGAQGGRYGPAYSPYGDSLFFGMGYGVSNVNNDWRMFTYCPIVLEAGTFAFGANLLSQNEVLLNWTTNGNKTGHRFEIEKSKDEVQWEHLGGLDASSAEGQSHYQFTDPSPELGENIYRLREYDFHNSIIFTAITRVSTFASIRDGIIIYPNPAMEFIEVMNTVGNQPIPFSVTNSMGGECIAGTVTPNENKIAIDELPAGIYTLLLHNNPASRIKFMKQ